MYNLCNSQASRYKISWIDMPIKINCQDLQMFTKVKILSF